MYVRYVLCNFLNGFIILVNVRSVILFNIYLGDTGMIVPLRSILCIIWPSVIILRTITFIHVVYVFRVLLPVGIIGSTFLICYIIVRLNHL